MSILLLLVFAAYSCGNRDNVRVIELEIFHTSQYCGGAAPSDELIEELNTPLKSNDTLYIYQGPDRSGEPLVVLMKDGKAKVSGLVDGAYFVYRFAPELIDKLEMSPDPTSGCYMEYYKHFSFVFDVKPSTIMVKDTFRKECNPCLEPAP